MIETTCANKQTLGKYKVLRIYSEEEKQVLTKYWREIVEVKMGRKIEDFHDLKVS